MTLTPFTPDLQPFTAEHQIGSLLCALVDTDRDPNTVAYSTSSATPIPACIVRSGTGSHNFTQIRRIFP